jgi:hypothetical protein
MYISFFLIRVERNDGQAHSRGEVGSLGTELDSKFRILKELE